MYLGVLAVHQEGVGRYEQPKCAHEFESRTETGPPIAQSILIDFRVLYIAITFSKMQVDLLILTTPRAPTQVNNVGSDAVLLDCSWLCNRGQRR